MKKTFALILAVAMVMSLAAVSLAAQSSTALLSLGKASKYDSDDNSLSVFGEAKKDSGVLSLQYGKSAYFLIQESGAPLSEYKTVEKLKVKAKWEMGGDLVKSLNVVKKYVKAANSSSQLTDDGYYYFLELATNVKETTSDSDIVGTLTFNRKKDESDKDNSKWVKEIKDEDEDIAINVFYENNYNAQGKVVTDRDYLKWDTKYLLKFDCDDEVELGFGYQTGGSNEGTFTVDVSGQGKIMFYYLTTADEAIAAANPGAKLKFINFFNTKFNRTGEFAYEMENGAYAYQIVDGKLVAIPGCEYDESDETFYFNTRVLGSYVFSDVELVDAAPAVTAPTETTPVVNPGTGAAA